MEIVVEKGKITKRNFRKGDGQIILVNMDI